jgi:hypothetical protein
MSAVTIDTQNADQVARLERLMSDELGWGADYNGARGRGLIRALESFEKPEEPAATFAPSQVIDPTPMLEWAFTEPAVLTPRELMFNGRTLLVIDPEDDEQAEGLAEALTAADAGVHDGRPCYSSTCRAEQAQTALRSLANSKPDEPTGLGAVVEAEDGRRWVRARPAGGPAKWFLWTTEPVELAYVWSSIPAVRVLSEGVSE